MHVKRPKRATRNTLMLYLFLSSPNYVFINKKQKQLEEQHIFNRTTNFVVLPDKHAIIIHSFIGSLSIEKLSCIRFQASLIVIHSKS